MAVAKVARCKWKAVGSTATGTASARGKEVTDTGRVRAGTRQGRDRFGLPGPTQKSGKSVVCHYALKSSANQFRAWVIRLYCSGRWGLSIRAPAWRGQCVNITM